MDTINGLPSITSKHSSFGTHIYGMKTTNGTIITRYID